MESLEDRLKLIAADRTSGASAIFEAALELLSATLSQRADLGRIARELVRAQPTMAPVWRASVEALAAADDPQRFATFSQRARRAPAALTRVAAEALSAGESALHLVTLSYSGAVHRALVALAARARVRVSCAEGRPALEGRRLARDLAAAGIEVECFSDAAIGAALTTATAVVAGADAVAPDSFYNKAGTRPLAAAAAQQGLPVYVLATRDKFIDAALQGRLAIREGAADEIWPDPPPGVTVRNPYFEATPLDLVSAVITDAGVIGAADVPEVCASALDASARQALHSLLSGR